MAAVCLVALFRIEMPPPVEAAPEPVIQPGREERVMALLGPLFREGFAGQKMVSVQIQGGELRLPFEGDLPAECPGAPAWQKAPAALVIQYRPRERAEPASSRRAEDGRSGAAENSGMSVAWSSCAPATKQWDESARSWASHLGRAYAGGIWGAEGETREAAAMKAGIITPFAVFLGLSPANAVAVAWACGFLLAWFCSCSLKANRSGPRRRIPPQALVVAALLFGLGLALRVSSMKNVPFDNDEIWAKASAHPILDDDHDAWIHPPLFRALQQTWAHRAGLDCFRIPSLLASVAALLACTLSWLRAPRWWSATALLLMAASPALLGDVTLARPYALAALWVVLVAAFSWQERRDGASWCVAIVGVGLAAHTDLLAGLAAFFIFGFALIEADELSLRRRALLAFASAAWLLPLAPGAWMAIHGELGPAGRENVDSGAHGDLNLAPQDTISQFVTNMVRLASWGTRAAGPLATAVGFFLFLGLAAFSLRKRRSLHGTSVIAVACLLVVASTFVRLRPRNYVFFSHLAPLAWITLPRRPRSPRA